MGFFAVFIKQKCDFILVGICRVGKINVLIGVHIRKVNFQRKNFGRNLSRRDSFPIDNRAFVMKFPQNLSSGVLFILIWYTKKGRNLSRVSKNDLNYWNCIYLS